ncbi:uncharacterized protein ana2 [Fopius arisanus]|uniref:RpoB_0 protein n=1 Tax=Fopius arisanus TaxID=64838 RepID=A0A0C9R8S5_9HYME|nr:PREDICTED: uncharacterized protein LOC105268527 [Fopius arisanus]
MANRNCNISGEIEPRVPRHPTAALTEVLPTVPEVSLAFDSPQQRIYYPNESRPSTVPTSYAKWKQQVPQKSIDPGVMQKVSRSLPSSLAPRKHNTALGVIEKPRNPVTNVFTKDSRLKFYQKINPESSQANPKILPTSNPSNSMKSSSRRSQMLLPVAPKPQESSDLEKVEVSSPPRREKTTCDCHSHQSENTEIINKLLSLVQSQNAQIQMLQGQVETLLSMRTERPRELNDYQRLPLPVHNASTNPIDPGLQNPRLQYSKSSRDVQELEEKQRDDSCKQLIKEKKVSIGVMTSFELTVQDSVVYNVDAPAVTDYQDKSSHPVGIKNLNSRATAPIGKVPTGPLEQIIEDSESHLSSTVQASNNFNTYSSARKSLQGNPQGDSLTYAELPQVNPQMNPQINPQVPALPQNQIHHLTDRPPESLKLTPRFSSGENRSPNPEKYSPAGRAVAPSNPRGDPAPGDVEPVKKTPQVGWTLYDNVMCQVNEILHNTQEEEKKEMVQEANGSKIVLNGIQQSTLEKLRLFGFTFADTSGCSEGKSLVDGRRMNPIPIDASYYPRLDYQANVIQTSGSASDTSLHMKALAMKYLGSKQLPNVSSHQRGMELFTSVVLSNIQNNIPGTSISEVPKMDSPRFQASPKALDYQRDNYLIHSKQSPHTPHSPHNILDISSLKRQPKLL